MDPHAANERLSAALADRYQIERELGMGGMATVYLAQDLKHHRHVAVKVLKPELAAVLGAERFVQEITTTAALQHPNILPLFDSGTADGFLYYVMPFIDGETLRAKLDRETQLSVDDAVRITRDVADALDYAHHKGVIHRDIKPENILLANGRPMVADFGIALALSAAAGGRMTETGLSLGTPHYMSPEQATAEKEITARSDIYSLGSVLYEMLTGNPPHTGASAQQIIMKIVTEDAAPVTRYRKAVPANVAAAVAKSLEKLPADRFATAKEFAEALVNPGFSVHTGTGAASAARDAGWKRRFYVASAAAAVLVVAAGVLIARQRSTFAALASSAASPLLVRLPLAPGDRIAVSPGEAITNADRPTRTTFAFSPDGKSLVFSGDRGGVRQLFLRPLVGETETPIAGTDSGESPFFSPDGRSLGFWSGGILRRLSLSGGPPTDIATLPRIIGASWGDNDRIVVGTLSHGLIVYSASGAKPDTLLEPGTMLPQWLPGSREILFTRSLGSRATDPNPRIEVVSADGKSPRLVIADGADARIVATGQLLFARRGTLMGVPFDVGRAEAKGSPVVVLEDVMQALNSGSGAGRVSAAQVAVSPAGHLAWIPGGITPDRPGNTVWVDRHGTVTPIDELGEHQFHAVRFSPDEKRFAVTTFGSKPSLQVFDIERKSSQTLLNNGQPLWPLWNADGRRLVRHGLVRDTLTVVSSLADDSRPATAVGRAAVEGYPAFWSSDGSELFVLRSGFGLTGIALATGVTRKIPNLPADTRWPALSPDGRWLAFCATIVGVGGGTDVYVQPWPALDRKWKVSTTGGTAPAWTKQGRELLYLAPLGVDSVGIPRYRMMSVDVTPGADFSAGTPHELFASPSGSMSPIRSWDVTADGSRFLMTVLRPVRAPPGEIHVLVNWLIGFPELAKR